MSLLLTASPDDAKAADAHFNRGVQLAARGDHVGSLAEFEAAYRLVPAWQVLFNLGVVRQKLAEPVPALEAFEAYLLQGGAEVPREKRQVVEQELVGLRKQVGEVVVRVEGGPAVIEVDGMERSAPRLYVLPGRHRVVARRDGESAAAELEVHRGERVVVALVAPAPPKPAVAEVVAPPAREEPVVLTPAPRPVEQPVAVVVAAPAAEAPTPWYGRWYVWAGAGAGLVVAGVVAGAAVAASRPRYDVRVETP
ncbi:MAG: hypothetical protein JNK82_41500 [Myxococcaceae bacterium]|nr:hypothetical protein [Myxococcaceae bacterium]